MVHLASEGLSQGVVQKRLIWKSHHTTAQPCLWVSGVQRGLWVGSTWICRHLLSRQSQASLSESVFFISVLQVYSIFINLPSRFEPLQSPVLKLREFVSAFHMLKSLDNTGL